MCVLVCEGGTRGHCAGCLRPGCSLLSLAVPGGTLAIPLPDGKRRLGRGSPSPAAVSRARKASVGACVRGASLPLWGSWSPPGTELRLSITPSPIRLHHGGCLSCLLGEDRPSCG